MNDGALYALLTAIGFKITTLTIRFLQEKGVAAIDTYTICRFALIPAFIWSLIFVRGSDIRFVLDSPKLLIIFGLIIVLWNLQAYIRALITNSTDSMVLLSTMFNILIFPLFLIVGIVLNGDMPNVFSIAGILLLLAAMLIKPTPHQKSLRPRLSKPLPLLVLLIFITACCDAVLQGVSREALGQLHPTVFLGLFSVPTLAVCWLISRFVIRRRAKVSVAMKGRQWLAIGLIPVTWFVASIPEAYSLAAIPIYIFISINVITFLMDTFSDVIHKRIHLGLQTISFIFTVLLGISLSIVSIH